MEQVTARSEWRTGWPAVLAGFLGMNLNTFHLVAIAALMKPLGEDFGWSRAQVSGGLMVVVFMMFVTLPVAGLLLPRFGARNIAGLGAALIGVSLLLVGLSGPEIWTWYASFGLLGFAVSLCGAVVLTTAVSQVFNRHRGLALALIMSGSGLSIMIYPRLVIYALNHHGWRSAFFFMAAAAFVFYLPVIWWLIGKSAKAVTASGSDVSVASRAGVTLGMALKDRAYWQILFAVLLVAMTVGMMTAHLQPMLRDANLTAEKAASYASMVGPAMILGRLLSGLALDHLPTRLVGGFFFGLPVIACLGLLGYDGSFVWGMVICVAYGLAYGAESDVLAYIVSRYFGLRDYALLFAVAYGMFVMGFGVAPVLAGLVYDLFGSYDRILYLLIAGLAGGVALILTMGRAHEDRWISGDTPLPAGGFLGRK